MKGTVGISLVAALLIFAAPGLMAVEPLNIDETGLVVVLPETILNQTAIDNGSYWEPYAESFGDGTFAVIAGVPADDNGTPLSETMNAKVSIIQPDGSHEEYWAFTDDAGVPYTGNFNIARTSGNPPRVACDARPGVYRFCVGQEATPWNFGEFTADRWVDPFLFDERHVACQLYELGDAGPVPLTNVFDALYGGIDGSQNGGHMRLGGDMRFLSNGNVIFARKTVPASPWPAPRLFSPFMTAQQALVLPSPALGVEMARPQVFGPTAPLLTADL
jgi:hypothetical protein